MSRDPDCLWDDRPDPADDLRRRPTISQPCRNCGALVEATPSKLRPFCSWECGDAWRALGERFRRKVGPPVVYVEALGPCTDWTGKLDEDGYGKIRDGTVFKFAHRVSYELEHGAVPPGRLVCHRCGRRACVAPEHLYAGTAEDNMRDLAVDNTGSGSKTEWADRLDMVRGLLERGETAEELAARYGVLPKTVLGWLERYIARDRVPDDFQL